MQNFSFNNLHYDLCFILSGFVMMGGIGAVWNALDDDSMSNTLPVKTILISFLCIGLCPAMTIIGLIIDMQ